MHLWKRAARKARSGCCLYAEFAQSVLIQCLPVCSIAYYGLLSKHFWRRALHMETVYQKEREYDKDAHTAASEAALVSCFPAYWSAANRISHPGRGEL